MLQANQYYALKLLDEENGSYSDDFYIVAKTPDPIVDYLEEKREPTRANYFSMTGGVPFIAAEGEWGDKMRGRKITVPAGSALDAMLQKNLSEITHADEPELPLNIKKTKLKVLWRGDEAYSYIRGSYDKGDEFVVEFEPQPLRRNALGIPMLDSRTFKVRRVMEMVPA